MEIPVKNCIVGMLLTCPISVFETRSVNNKARLTESYRVCEALISATQL